MTCRYLSKESIPTVTNSRQSYSKIVVQLSCTGAISKLVYMHPNSVGFQTQIT